MTAVFYIDDLAEYEIKEIDKEDYDKWH